MANELATAYIQLLPSFRGLRREIERGLRDAEPAAARAGERAGRSFQEEFSDSAAGNTAAEFARQGADAGVSFVDGARRELSGGEFDRIGARAGDSLVEGVESVVGRGAVDAEDLVADRGEFTREGRIAGDGFLDGVDGALSGGVLLDGGDLLGSRGEFEQAGRRAGESAADGVGGELDGITGSFEDVLGGLPAPALAAGAAIGAVLVQGITAALERGRLESQFEAALGVSEGVAARLGERAGRVYADNYGDSLEQVGDAVTRVQRTFGDELSGDELDEVTEKALTLTNVFDEDLNGVIRAASKLITTGLAEDADDAFDLITTGLQGTANEGQDLLDTFNEYSVQFERLGLDGEDALNLITQGLQNGARDSDVLADAFKEFSIRAVDGSAEVEQAFGTLGIEDAAERIAAGGDTAREALGEVLDGLRAIEDPALRSQVAVRLFGTQAEDLGGALLALDLDETADGLDDIAGSSDRVTEAFDDTASNFEQLKRALTGEIGEGVNRFLALPAELLDDERSWSGAGAAAAETFWGAFTFNPVVRVAIGRWRDGVIDQLTSGTFGDIGSVIGLSFAGGEEVETPDWLSERLNGAPEVLDEFADAAERAGVSSEIAADGTDAIANALERARTQAGLASVELEASAAAAEAYLTAIENASSDDDLAVAGLASGAAIRDALEGAAAEGVEALRLPPLFDAVTAALGGYTESQEGALDALISAGEASQGVIAGLIESGNVQGAVDAADRIRDKFLNDILPALGVTDQAAQDYYLTLLGLDETTVDTAIELSGAEEALSTLGLYSEILQNLGTFDIEDQFRIADLIATGDIEGARALIDQEIAEGRTALTLDVRANTQPATTDVANWVEVESERPPVKQKISAETSEARTIWEQFRGDVTASPVVNQRLGLDVAAASSTFDQFRASIAVAPALFIDVGLRAVGSLADLLGGDQVAGVIDIIRAVGIDLPGFSTGGLIEGPGTSTSDSIIARLSDGEYVMDAATVSAYGVDFFAALQRRQLPGFATGGLVGTTPAPPPVAAAGVNVDYTVVEAKSRPRPEDLVRVTRSAMFLQGAS